MTRLREYGRDVSGRDFIEGIGNSMHTFYRADGSGVAINLSDGTGRGWKPENTWADVANLNDPGPAPPLLVYITTTVEDGTIPNIKVADMDNFCGEFGGPRRLPKQLSLHITDPEGGFIHYPVEDPKALIDHRFNRGMRQAPAAGYEQSLTIYPDRHIPVYFFIKAGDRYGKGVLRGVKVAEDGSRVDCIVKLYMQDDGSRNLETFRFGPS